MTAKRATSHSELSWLLACSYGLASLPGAGLADYRVSVGVRAARESRVTHIIEEVNRCVCGCV